eukprot:gb/GEZN01000558.1/.p1 GENE.gb/GEZN01000558.1/~~gb/GEZN01000558.1/.p1  ORF type:complete len:1250 (-),score=275.08 gb/GEZN01000558.1/:267-4016(-)
MPFKDIEFDQFKAQARQREGRSTDAVEDVKVFRAFEALSAKTDIKAKPTCVATCDQYVIVGCNNGSLMSFRIVDESKMTLELHKTKKLSKAIKQLEVIDHPQMHLLLVLSNGTITAHLPDDLVQQSEKGSVSGVSTYFSVDPKPPFSIAFQKARRRFTIFTYGRGSGKWEQDAEMFVPDWVLGTEWVGKSLEKQGKRRQSLCLAYKSEYSIVDIDSGKITKVPLSLDSNGPCLKATQDQELLLATNHLGLFINDQGTLEAKSTISWTANPVEIRLCAHYIMAAMPDGSIEISSLLDLEQAHVQTVEAQGGNPVLSIHADSNRCVVLTKDGVQVLQLCSLLEQVATYLQHARVKQAESLLLMTKPSASQLADFHAEAGWVLFKELRFQDALDHLSKSNVDPRDVIQCFPDLRLEEFPYVPKHPEAAKQDIFALVTEGKKLAKRKSPSSCTHREILERSNADLCKQAKFWLSDYLWKFCLKHGRDRCVIAQSRVAGSGTDKKKSKGPSSGFSTEQVVFVTPADSAVQVAVDTALLMLNVMHGEMDESDIAHEPVRAGVNLVVHGASSSTQLAENNELYPFCLEDLLFPKNQCQLTICEYFLISRRRFDTLALLYLSHNLLKKALEVWSHLGSGQFKERACRMHPDARKRSSIPSTFIPTQNLITPLPNLPSPTASLVGGVGLPLQPLQTELASKHPGLWRSASLLSQLAASDLLWQYSAWCLQTAPLLGIQIFTAPPLPSRLVPTEPPPEGGFGSRDAPLRLQLLDPARVLNFLKEQPRVGSHDLVQMYLEHLAPHTHKYHQDLAELYLRRVVSLQIPPALRHKAAAAAQSAAFSPPASPSGTHATRRTSSPPSPPDSDQVSLSGLRQVSPGQEPGLLGQARKKLYAFLNQSDHYQPSLLLQMAEDNELWQELVVLYKKLSLHRKVLEVFIFKIRDPLGAAEYCRTTWQKLHTPSLTHTVALGLGEFPGLLFVSTAEANSTSSEQPKEQDAKGKDAKAGQKSSEPSTALFETLVDIYCSPAYRQASSKWAQENSSSFSSTSCSSSSSSSSSFSKETEKQQTQRSDYQQQVVALLTHYHAYTDPVRVLKKLPPDFPLFSLGPYLSAVIPRTIHARRTSQVVKNLCRQDHLEAKSACIDARSASFLIQDNGPVCAYCRKWIGVVAFRTMPVPQPPGGPEIQSDCRFPKDFLAANPELAETAHKVVHYRCAEDYHKLMSARMTRSSDAAAARSRGRKKSRGNSPDPEEGRTSFT